MTKVVYNLTGGAQLEMLFRSGNSVCSDGFEDVFKYLNVTPKQLWLPLPSKKTTLLKSSHDTPHCHFYRSHHHHHRLHHHYYYILNHYYYRLHHHHHHHHRLHNHHHHYFRLHNHHHYYIINTIILSMQLIAILCFRCQNSIYKC